MNVYLLRNGNEDYNGVAVVVAFTKQQAIDLTTWDYSDKTTEIKKLDGLSSGGDARVAFQSYGG